MLEIEEKNFFFYLSSFQTEAERNRVKIRGKAIGVRVTRWSIRKLIRKLSGRGGSSAEEDEEEEAEDEDGAASTGIEDRTKKGRSGSCRGEEEGSGSSTVSARGGPGGGRGSASRRASRELSPSSTSSSSSKGGSRSGNPSGQHGCGPESQLPPGGGQDWRRLVGSIRRKVRRKTTQSSASLAESGLRESCNSNRNQDDFLKATMRIFLVVSPPMGRVQVTLAPG